MSAPRHDHALEVAEVVLVARVGHDEESPSTTTALLALQALTKLLKGLTDICLWNEYWDIIVIVLMIPKNL